jgi:hypothetical protein
MIQELINKNGNLWQKGGRASFVLKCTTFVSPGYFSKKVLNRVQEKRNV